MERFLKPGEGFLVARVIRFVLQFEGILAQVIKLVFRSMMEFVHEGFGPIVFLGPRNPGCGEVETLGTGVFLLDHFQGLAQADVGSDAFVVWVVDQAELTVPYRAYGVDPFAVVDDTAVGEGAEDVFAGLLELLPSEQRKKAHAVARARLEGSSGRFDEGRGNVCGGDQVLDYGSGAGYARPAHDEPGAQSIVVAGPFGEGELGSLFTANHENGVVPELSFLELLSHHSH